MKLILLLCLLTLTPLIICERSEMEAQMLQKLGNLPHRYLGVLYWNMILNPNRSDYAKNYLLGYMMASDGELIHEGMRHPVISMMAVDAAREFPRNQELQALRKITMHNHYQRLEEDKKK